MITDKFVHKDTDNNKMITDKQGANFQKETDNSKIITDKKGAIKGDDIWCTNRSSDTKSRVIYRFSNNNCHNFVVLRMYSTNFV